MIGLSQSSPSGVVCEICGFCYMWHMRNTHMAFTSLGKLLATGEDMIHNSQTFWNSIESDHSYHFRYTPSTLETDAADDFSSNTPPELLKYRYKVVEAGTDYQPLSLSHGTSPPLENFGTNPQPYNLEVWTEVSFRQHHDVSRGHLGGLFGLWSEGVDDFTFRHLPSYMDYSYHSTGFACMAWDRNRGTLDWIAYKSHKPPSRRSKQSSSFLLNHVRWLCT